MEETIKHNPEHKVLIGFKCSPSVRASLCSQADKLGVSLSSFIETIVLNQEENNRKFHILTERNKALSDHISFYESSFLKDLFEQYKGKNIIYKNREGKRIQLTINSIQDVFTIITNSFKLTK